MKPIDSTVLLLACAVGLSACAGMSNPLVGLQELWEKDPTRVAELQPVINRIALTPLWDYSVGSEYSDPDSHVAPWIDRDHVLLAANDGEVVALNASTGVRGFGKPVSKERSWQVLRPMIIELMWEPGDRKCSP